MKNDYPQHTPELAKLFAEMEKANETLAKVARKQGLSARRSPEYKTAMAAYRAYWDAVDADRVASYVKVDNACDTNPRNPLA